ncbi:n-terminal Xaa-Pro-Lys N-methyltransferase 1-B [Trichonephila clavata]|uniref:Alpha N-terminal protein methyltransferase 1 n=1 Tax=Trichonephila clavata TaxID=2740835 RepID=A0A8X6L8D1_TRICU|nr:n-terminal Xaa-Pro-Lys N-methyltransferase 1-B [Trichonephila clavata]
MYGETNDTDFYAKGKSYWENVPATIDGMLGGHSNVFNADIQASSRFINTFLQDKTHPVGTEYALDCGSGIGRITKHFLLKFFKSVDMVEQNKNFLDESDSYLEEDSNRVMRKFNCGLQDFVPDENCYDVIWIQWVLGYLTNDDVVSFLERCKKGLKENGIIVIKDNVSSSGTDMDHDDGSVTRPRKDIIELATKADLKVLAEKKQYKFPKGLYEVRMFAFR